jgi:hypothetical protein
MDDCLNRFATDNDRETYLWAIGLKDKQLSDYLDLINDQGKQIAQLQAEIVRLQDQVFRAVRGDFGQICDYCGWESNRKGAAWKELQKHIRQCPAHPLTAMTADRDRERGLRLKAEWYVFEYQKWMSLKHLERERWTEKQWIEYGREQAGKKSGLVMSRARHNCNQAGVNNWQECVACGGRIHLAGCTSKPNPRKDCCRARHEKFIRRGVTKGIYDTSVEMQWEEHSREQDGK